MSWRLNLLPALSLLGFLAPAIHAEPGSCPSVLSEAPPYGDPPHSAQLQIVQHSDCPFIDRVTAVLYSGDERLTSRTYFEDSIAASPLRFPVADSVELPERAGLYRIEWTAEFSDASAQSFTQTFALPCPAPILQDVRWSDADRSLSLVPAPGDRCEGEISAVLSVSDVTSSSEIAAGPVSYRSDSADPAPVSIGVPDVRGERRYIGSLVLTNDANRSVDVPVEFVSGCGPLDPEARIVSGRMVGSVTASDCQFPITIEISVIHESGQVFKTVDALLLENSFDFDLPEFSSWPAGDYTIESQFVGAQSRGRLTNTLSVSCPSPSLSKPSLDITGSDDSAELSFELSSRDYCQDETRVGLQVRDANRVVVFNRTLDLPPGSDASQIRLPFSGVPGASYDVQISAHFGLDYSQTVSLSESVLYECTAPVVLDLGYSNPDASHIAGLVALTACNAPATARLLVRNAEGRLVVDAEPQILQDVGTAYARIAPISLGHLDSGEYTASLSVADNRGRPASREVDLVLDSDGPEINFTLRGQSVESGELPTVRSLDELSLTFSDAHKPLSAFSPYSGSPSSLHDDPRLDIQRVDGESTPQIWFTGIVDVPRLSPSLGFKGILIQSPDGNQWISPIARQFVPSERSDLTGFHPSRHRIGFRSVARTQPLDTGRYHIVGIVAVDSEGRDLLIPGSGTFSVSSLASQYHDAVLRQGVTEIPVALVWSDDNTATLERITSVPDGDYTFSAIGRDSFGTPSDTASLVLRLDQTKERAALEWPALSGYRRVFRHQFRASGSVSTAPLRVLYRRVEGYGSVKINGRNVTDQTSEEVLQPNADGVFSVEVELLQPDVQGSFVIHADSTDAKPLELTISTYSPQFVTQRTRDQYNDLLTINYTDQPCRKIVFDDLSHVSIRADEVVCAVRLNIPGTSVLSTSDDRSEVRLPQGVSNSALYEEGFVRLINGVPSFQPTRQVPITEMRAFSATPRIDFVPLVQWRNRAAEGRFVTSPGHVVAGHLLIRPGLDQPVVRLDGEALDLPSNSAGSIRIPLRTRTDALGDRYTVTLNAHYPETPDLSITRTLEFVAVPPALFVEAQSGSFVTPGDLSMTLKLRDGSGRYDPTRHGTYELIDASVSSREDPGAPLPSPGITLDSTGNLSVEFRDLSQGSYRLHLTFTSTDTRFSDYLAPFRAETPFEIHDGSPVEAGVFTFRSSDKTPFYGQLSVDYQEDRRRRDVSRVAWEVSSNNVDFEPLQCCGHSVDFALTEPGSRFFRAALTNRHSGVVSYTDVKKISAFLSGELQVIGPRQTFRGFPAEYHVKDLPKGYDVLWRVRSPSADTPVEIRSPSLTIPAAETGVYYVEVIADTASEDPDSLSALRTFFTLDCSWPRIPSSVISGPTMVEYGKTYTFTVTHPPIFQDRGNPAVERVGEWQLPDGTRVQDDEWATFTLRELPEGYSSADILYQTWLKGDPTTLTTAVHKIRPVAYRWPNWRLNVSTTSVEPPAILRLSVSPEDWREWMDLGSAPITTHWDLPDHIRVLFRTPSEAIVEAVDDRPFDVLARVTDPRGNITRLERPNIRPLKQVPFEISLRAVADRTLHTAPIDITAHVDPIVVPKGRSITRVAFYVNGLYRGVSDGSPIELQIRSPGEHRLRAIASIDNEFTSDDTITLSIGENHQALCKILPVGDFRLNGLAKAQCDDPDGHMVEYRWYADGRLLSDSGTRVQLSRPDRLGLSELSLIAVDNAGLEARARYTPPSE